jgi:hypothetical protein
MALFRLTIHWPLRYKKRVLYSLITIEALKLGITLARAISSSCCFDPARCDQFLLPIPPLQRFLTRKWKTTPRLSTQN